MIHTMKLALTGLVFTCLGLVVAGSALSGVPRQINYQGRLTDQGTGEPLTGEHELVFRLYAESVGGSELWSETDTLEADAQGVVSAILGARQPIDVALDQGLWLEVTVDGEVLSPRREMVSVPFALRAAASESADSLAGFDAAAFADTAHNHDDRYLTESELSTSGTINAADNPVDWTRLKSVPAGFADGADDVGGVGDGHSLDAADGDPVDALYVDDEGDVGIGTMNPQSRLHVENSSDAGYTYAIRGVSSSTGTAGQIAGVVGETWSTATSNSGAGVMGFAASSTGHSSGVMGASSADQGAGVVGRADHASGQTYGVVGTCESPNGYAGYFAGERSYFSGKVGIGKLSPQRKLHVEENSSADSPVAILGVVMSPTARWGTGVSGHTYCADTVYVGAGVAGYAQGATSRSSGVMGMASGSRGAGIRGIATHETGENVGVMGDAQSSNGFGCYMVGPRNFFSGKVGVGTLNPQARLHIHEASGPGGLQITHMATGSGSSDGLQLTSAATGRGSLINMENQALDLGTNGTADLTIHPDGKVSIGEQDTLGSVTISYPEPRLIINSTRSTHGSASIDLYHLGTHRCGIGWHSENGAMLIGGGYPLFITDGGRLGFNGPNPANVLDVTGAGTTWGGVNGYTEVVGHFRNTLGGHTAVSIDAAANLDPILYFAENGVAYWDLRTDSDASQKFELRYHGPGMRNDIHLVADTLGNVGIGTGDPAGYKLNIGGSGYASGGWDILGNVAIGTADDHGYRLYVAGSAYSTGGWSSSDARLKDKIEPIDDALGKSLALRGVTFEWRRDEFPDKGLPEGRHYGLIAQEVERVLPEAVKEGPDGEKAVAYDEIIPVLVEALRAQEARIAALEQEVRNLRGRP